MRRKLVAVLLLVAIAAAAAWAAESRRPAKLAPPRKDADVIAEFARSVRVESSEVYRNLAVFPVVAAGVRVPPVDMPLDRAVGKDLVAVVERDESEVNRLHVVSRAKEPVFAMAGEMLRGGKQDRIIAQDLVIPPHAKIEVAVYCVEHGRWAMGAGGGASFSAGRSMAGSAVRRAAGGGARGGGGGQGAVWEEVAASQERLKAPSRTGALRSVHDSAEVQRRIAPYQRALTDLCDDHPKANGVVVVVDGEVLAADLFASPSLFRQLWPELLEAYAIDALEHGSDTSRGPRGMDQPTAREIRHWLAGAATAERTRKDTSGEGADYALRGRELMGSVLVWEGGVVHLEAFPRAAEARRDFNSLRFRREQLDR
jgi:hypothetical protein